MSLPDLTGVGRLVDDPSLRYTSSGKPVAKMRIAFSAGRINKQTGEWEDGDKCFLTAEIWDQPAEHAAESLQRGTEVVVSGRLRQREYETREGERRTLYELLLYSIGPSLRYATAKVQKMSRSSGNGGGQQVDGGFDDPWATAAPASVDTSRSASRFGDDEPPF